MVFGGAPTNPFGATANANPFGSFGTAATARPFGGVQASTDDEAARAIRRGTRVAVRGIRQAQQPNAGRIGRRTGFESVELDAKRTGIVVHHA
jgi:hypothetical protein